MRPNDAVYNAAVAVIGAGVTGLVAARRLTLAGYAVTLYERSDRVGGQVHTVPFAGRSVDIGAEALHLASPAVRTLITEIGLDDSAVASNPGKTWLQINSRLVTMPAGVGPAGPTRLGPVISSRALSLRGLARAALEPIKARRKVDADISVAEFITHRFGREVTETFVDPMLGGLHSGDISRLSLQSAAPMLAAAARTGKPLTTSRKLRRATPTAPASFITWPTGLSTFSDALARDLTDLRLGADITGIEAKTGCFTVSTPSDIATYDAVVIAAPALAAAGLLADVPQAVAALGQMHSATVASLLVSFDRNEVARVDALRGTGILLGRGSGRLLKSATFLTSKWPHLAEPLTNGSDDVIVRLSAGRAGDTVVGSLDDDELATRLLADLRELIGLDATPTATLLHRWNDTMPQLEIGHADKVAAVRSNLPPGAFITGASYDGVGLASAVSSGERVAAEVGEHLNPTTP